MIDLSNITKLLDSNRLKEALTELDALAVVMQDWQLRNDIEEVQTAYNYMLQYMKQGVKDPNRKELYQNLIRKAYGLKNRLHTAHAIQTDKSCYYETVRRKIKHPGKSLTNLLMLLEYQNKIEADHTTKEETTSAQTHSEILVELFEKVWVLSTWSDVDTEEMSLFLQSDQLSNNDLALLVSAVTMSIIRTYDIRKFSFLCNTYTCKHLISKQRALIGIAITALYHDTHISQDPKAMQLIEELISNTEFKNAIHIIQMQLLLTRETQKIDQKMRDEIIPNIQKVVKKQKNHFEEIEDLDENNPNWTNFFGDSKVEKHIKELGDLQLSGADLYMNSFSQLKYYPFFRTMAHWFFPFDANLLDLKVFDYQEQEKEFNIFKIILNSPGFCNSDKYSFYFSLSDFSKEKNKMIAQELHQNQLPEEGSELFQKLINPELHEEDLSRQYIHDLYRFFKLWRNHSEEPNIFDNPFHLWECNSLSKAFTEQKELKEIADYFLKNNYPKEAATLYEQIVKFCFTEAELWQKAAYAYQKQKEYKKAIEYYLQADLIEPDSLWVNKNLAQCYRKEGLFTKALSYYRKVEKVEPDNLLITLQIGFCLIELQLYQEALPSFFKIEYYEKSSIQAQRAIGWCYFMLGKYEDAIKQLNKVVQAEKATLQDWLNSGHAYYAHKEVERAIACYKKAEEKSKDRNSFIATFMADSTLLYAHNFSTEDIYLLLDTLL
ncbi:MAG: tetratricopeptide repeat protein [Phocaeicola sp.]